MRKFSSKFSHLRVDEQYPSNMTLIHNRRNLLKNLRKFIARVYFIGVDLNTAFDYCLDQELLVKNCMHIVPVVYCSVMGFASYLSSPQYSV